MTTSLSATCLAATWSGDSRASLRSLSCIICDVLKGLCTATIGLLRVARPACNALGNSHEDSQNVLCRWAATLGIVLAISRGFIAEQGLAFEPELALLEVVAHTHWLPRHWRGRGHTREVQEQFQQLFQFKVRRNISPAVTPECKHAAEAGPCHA